MSYHNTINSFLNINNQDNYKITYAYTSVYFCRNKEKNILKTNKESIIINYDFFKSNFKKNYDEIKQCKYLWKQLINNKIEEIDLSYFIPDINYYNENRDKLKILTGIEISTTTYEYQEHDIGIEALILNVEKIE